MQMRPPAALDLSRRVFCRPHLATGITVYGTWYRDDARTQPALVLLPTGRKVGRAVRPCVIPLSDAHLWAEETGDPLYFCNAAAMFAEALGMDGGNPLHVSRVLSAVHDEIGELLSMPPLPPGEIAAVADAFVTNADGKTRHLEIHDRV